MTILAKTLLTLVRRHLMTLVLLSVWHNCYYLRVVNCLFYLTCKALSGLECGDTVLRNSDSGVL